MYEEFIDITKLPPEGLSVERTIHSNAWKIQEVDWESRGELSFRVHLKGNSRKLEITGKFAAGITARCHRCLKPIDLDLSRSFHLTYLPPDMERFSKEEVELTPEELEIAYLDRSDLPLHDVIREQIYLTIPMKILCRVDCRGLCPHCGVDLNEIECSCAEQQIDPRWASLKSIASKKK